MFSGSAPPVPPGGVSYGDAVLDAAGVEVGVREGQRGVAPLDAPGEALQAAAEALHQTARGRLREVPLRVTAQRALRGAARYGGGGGNRGGMGGGMGGGL